MKPYICTTCGVQYNESKEVPTFCSICTDDRQYVNANGQEWTTLNEMKSKKLYTNEIMKEEENLYSIKTTPTVGIGQTAYIVQDNGFNVLWDCISMLDKETIDKITELGGIDAIAVSHPHFYSTQVEWAEAFDAPIHIHEDDKEWIMRDSKWIKPWSGEQLILSDNLILNRLGGHFRGSAVLNWTTGNNNKGVLLSGDTIQVVPDTGWVSFMYSFPNLIPLPPTKIEEIVSRSNELHYDSIYNAFHKVIKSKGKEAVQKSADRYIKALKGELFNT